MLILAGYYFYLFLALLSPFSSGTRMFHNPHENLVEKKIGGAERVTASYSTSRKKADEFAPSRLKYNHIRHHQCSLSYRASLPSPQIHSHINNSLKGN